MPSGSLRFVHSPLNSLILPESSGSLSHTRDLSCISFPCAKSYPVLQRSSSTSVKRPSVVLIHSSLQGNDTVVYPSHHYSNRSISIHSFRKATRSNSFSRCQVKSEDSEGTLSSESLVTDEQTLEQELQKAVKEENYSRAAKIRDSLRLLQEDGKASVLAANARFYHSFRNGDLASMQSLWAKNDSVCVVHPGVSGISGYDLVMGSWEFVWADYDFPLDIEIKDAHVHVRGDVGYVTCIELFKAKSGKWGRQFATNVFERINGQWFICIHHASHVDV